METTVGDRRFQIGKLDAFAQLHVARKLSPAMPLIDGLVKQENAGKDLTLLALIALSHLSDVDSEYVIRKCLTVVSVRQEAGWAKLTGTNGELMFDDTPMPTILHLTTRVIEENLGDFFRTALGDLDKAASQ